MKKKMLFVMSFVLMITLGSVAVFSLENSQYTFVGLQTGAINILDENGELVAENTTYESVTNSMYYLEYRDGVLYATTQARLFALDVETNTILWDVEPSSNANFRGEHIEYDDTHLYVQEGVSGEDLNYIRKIELATGNDEYSRIEINSATDRFLLYDDYLYVVEEVEGSSPAEYVVNKIDSNDGLTTVATSPDLGFDSRIVIDVLQDDIIVAPEDASEQFLVLDITDLTIKDTISMPTDHFLEYIQVKENYIYTMYTEDWVDYKVGVIDTSYALIETVTFVDAMWVEFVGTHHGYGEDGVFISHEVDSGNDIEIYTYDYNLTTVPTLFYDMVGDGYGLRNRSPYITNTLTFFGVYEHALDGPFYVRALHNENSELLWEYETPDRAEVVVSFLEYEEEEESNISPAIHSLVSIIPIVYTVLLVTGVVIHLRSKRPVIQKMIEAGIALVIGLALLPVITAFISSL